MYLCHEDPRWFHELDNITFSFLLFYLLKLFFSCFSSMQAYLLLPRGWDDGSAMAAVQSSLLDMDKQPRGVWQGQCRNDSIRTLILADKGHLNCRVPLMPDFWLQQSTQQIQIQLYDVHDFFEAKHVHALSGFRNYCLHDPAFCLIDFLLTCNSLA